MTYSANMHGIGLRQTALGGLAVSLIFSSSHALLEVLAR